MLDEMAKETCGEKGTTPEEQAKWKECHNKIQ